MTARALLTPKSEQTFQFEDRLLQLDTPVKIGRSHKEDRSESGNGYFDCKVLSRAHAVLCFDEGKFFIVDTGSSNGSFVNNIRLSKCGEESKVTQLYTGDLLRFGSDVLDKARNITQKCIVARLTLFYPDGAECATRPSQSRLFRPEVGRVDTQQGGEAELQLERVLGEKAELVQRLADIESQLADREIFCSSISLKQERDATEITKLRLLVDTQNSDLAGLESALNECRVELGRAQEDSQAVALRDQLAVAASTERALIDKVRSLEAEMGSAQAEAAGKDVRGLNYQQTLEYKVECLTTELQHCRLQLQQAETNKVVERSPDDIKMLEEQAKHISKLKDDLSYIKKELIEARSLKAASEDELNTVKGTVETITNNGLALSSEIEVLKAVVVELQARVGEENSRAEHLHQLVTEMEAQPGVEAQSRVEIADLKAELAGCQCELKERASELAVREERLRGEREIIQQRDIEISRLAGQLDLLQEEMHQLELDTGNAAGLQAEINRLRSELAGALAALQETRADNVALSSELQQQQTLTNQLKGLRGSGEEVEMLEAARRDAVAAREQAGEFRGRWEEAQAGLETSERERRALLAENTELREKQPASEAESPPAALTTTAPAPAPSSAPARTLAAGEAVMANIGSLKMYEIFLGVFFLIVIISWNPFF